MKQHAHELGVKMCGNCNPYIEAGKIAKRVAEYIGAVIVPSSHARVILSISACDVACVQFTCQSAADICGLSVNGVACETEEELIEKTASLLSAAFLSEK